MAAPRAIFVFDDVIAIGNAILRAEWNSRWPKRPRSLAERLHGTAPPELH